MAQSGQRFDGDGEKMGKSKEKGRDHFGMERIEVEGTS
jgi:hypothetical protein